MEVAERASIRVSMSMARERSMALMCIGCEMSEDLREQRGRRCFMSKVYKRNSTDVDI